MLRWRLLLGTLIIAALVALCWLDNRATAMPGAWLMPVAIAATVLATKEILDLAAAANMRPLRWTVYVGNLLLVTGTWLAIAEEHWRKGLPFEWGVSDAACEIVVAASLAVAVLGVFLGEMGRYKKPGGNTANLAVAVFALVYVGLMLWFAVQMRIVWGIGRWRRG